MIGSSQSPLTPATNETVSGSNLNKTNFDQVVGIMRSETGISISESKRTMVQSRLSAQLRKSGHANFTDYIAAVIQNPRSRLKSDFISALTTNVTSFFREPHHFEYFSHSVVETLAEYARGGRPIRIWSAGCSSGQEPISIAIELFRKIPDISGMNIKILATDISKKVLQNAAQFTYDTTIIAQEVGPDYKKHFTLNLDKSEATANPYIQKIISYRELNLIQNWPMKIKSDVIFCRNVVIYFDEETQKDLWRKFSDQLRPGGHLFIGHSERIEDCERYSLRPVGITTYQKQ